MTSVLNKINSCQLALEQEVSRKIETLMKFYNVGNTIDLVLAQSLHVDKLQNKLQHTEGSFYIGRSRVG